ncbi:MAG TPA: hypothetical protein VFP60_11795 [Pseudolabrys sp.]|nr:hypothetical protein [Pseudolabrys sp.]
MFFVGLVFIALAIAVFIAAKPKDGIVKVTSVFWGDAAALTISTAGAIGIILVLTGLAHL